ncbi:hypothetical protein KFU94_65550 [Chloroflexi bacterium TSY]|nr:hypothetical protein [Chloroflexi bacterium TSY]
MPDFEDIFDGVKKQFRKQKKRSKKSKKREKREGQYQRSALELLIERFQGGSDAHDSKPITNRQPPSAVNNQEINQAAPNNETLRSYLTQAQAYHQGIVTLVNQASSEFNRARLTELTRYIDHWQSSLVALIQRVDQFQQNALLQHDLKAVPKAIARLETQLAEASSAQIQRELKRTLTNREQQLSALENLHHTMQWAEIKIENTVSILGTIYSQALMSQSKGQVANYQRLLLDVEEEARALDDYVATLTEIKLGDILTKPTNRMGDL